MDTRLTDDYNMSTLDNYKNYNRRPTQQKNINKFSNSVHSLINFTKFFYLYPCQVKQQTQFNYLKKRVVHKILANCVMRRNVSRATVYENQIPRQSEGHFWYGYFASKSFKMPMHYYFGNKFYWIIKASTIRQK